MTGKHERIVCPVCLGQTFRKRDGNIALHYRPGESRECDNKGDNAHSNQEAK